MMGDEVIKGVLLEELGLPNSSRSVDTVIRAYEKRYGYKVSNWGKLEQDLRVLFDSDYSNKFDLGRRIVKKVLESGLNHVYVSNDLDCVKFREALFRTKSSDFMRRVRLVFN